MYPATIVTWVDESEIRQPEITTVRTMPLYCAVITSDKGTEDWVRLSGQDWFNMYTVGNYIDFNRHGQALLQAGNAIQAGAEMLCKRICAEDACLANLAVIATTKTEQVQATNSAGEPLYTTADGVETTEEQTEDGTPNTPVMVDQTTVSYSYRSAEGCTNRDQVISTIEQDLEGDPAEEGTQRFLLYVIFDNGRGESKKRIRIIPNYTLSRNYANYFMYDLIVMESGKTIDTIHFVLDPDLVFNDSNLSLQYQASTETTQIAVQQYDQNLRDFMDAMIAATGMEETTAVGMDLLYGTTKKQKQISSIVVDTEGGVDLQIITGQLLLNGDNGEFGTNPLQAESYARLAAKAFAGYDPHTGTIDTYANGCYDPRIYDVDRYKIDAVLDANYPADVKRAIEQLATFREDFMYFRDMGTDCNTLELIEFKDFDNLHDKFCSTYCTYYDIIDPYSKKQITVTIMYSMARLLVNTFNNGRNLPIAGIRHGFIIPEAIKNTVGFTPAICPGLNQKEELYEDKINYASYINDELVVETLFTSQDNYTQLSFANNVLAVQHVIKQIRTRCPAIRYSFIDGDDLAKYKAEVEEIIAPYRSYFKKLELTYMSDPYYTENKIFYATLAVQFRDFVQTEYFKVVALGSNA